MRPALEMKRIKRFHRYVPGAARPADAKIVAGSHEEVPPATHTIEIGTETRPGPRGSRVR